jgi:hypothetical protein
MERRISYMFRDEHGTKIQSDGTAGVRICGQVNHELTKVGDIVEIIQYNLSDSYPFKATIIGKRSCDWDISKPLYHRQSNLVIEGEMK